MNLALDVDRFNALPPERQQAVRELLALRHRVGTKFRVSDLFQFTWPSKYPNGIEWALQAGVLESVRHGKVFAFKDGAAIPDLPAVPPADRILGLREQLPPRWTRMDLVGLDPELRPFLDVALPELVARNLVTREVDSGAFRFTEAARRATPGLLTVTVAPGPPEVDFKRANPSEIGRAVQAAGRGQRPGRSDAEKCRLLRARFGNGHFTSAEAATVLQAQVPSVQAWLSKAKKDGVVLPAGVGLGRFRLPPSPPPESVVESSPSQPPPAPEPPSILEEQLRASLKPELEAPLAKAKELLDTLPLEDQAVVVGDLLVAVEERASAVAPPKESPMPAEPIAVTTGEIDALFTDLKQAQDKYILLSARAIDSVFELYTRLDRSSRRQFVGKLTDDELRSVGLTRVTAQD